MIVHYYEASALAHPGNTPGCDVTLEDRHQTAWRLFTGGENHPEDERPFLFRAEALSSHHELFMLRSCQPFAGAKQHQLDLSEGATLNLEWITSPTISSFQRGKRGKRRQAFPEEWSAVGLRMLGHAGLTLLDDEALAYRLHEKRHHFSPNKPPNRLVRYRAEVQVSDPRSAALAWITGIGRLRAYGLGMLCLADPGSPGNGGDAS